MDIDKFIRDLPWSDQATDHEKTLVAGNLRSLYAAMVDAAQPLRAIVTDLEALIDDQLYDDRVKSELDFPDDCEWHVVLTEKICQRVTHALNETNFLQKDRA